MKTIARSADDLLGTYRSFGPDGPVYRVVQKIDDLTVRVSVIETGEELDYPIAQALNDPDPE